jgi:hypothetical protein
MKEIVSNREQSPSILINNVCIFDGLSDELSSRTGLLRPCFSAESMIRSCASVRTAFGENGRSGRCVATDGVDQEENMTFPTFLEDSKFFFTRYHAGRVNIILHAVSFSFLFYGLTVKSMSLVLIGLFIFDEMGHAYNYFFVHNRDPRFGLRMIPYQFLYVSLIMLVLLKLFGWF